jgi:hypothetical protein
MAWNGPVDGDWSVVDFNQAPWNNGICVLTHDEVIFVIEALPEIEAEYLPNTDMVISKFNALTAWEKCINGVTYAVIKGYNADLNSQGINESGIVPELPSVEPIVEPVIEVPEVEPVAEPTQEEPV